MNVGRMLDGAASKGGTRMASGLLAASRCERMRGLTGDELLTEEGVDERADDAEDDTLVEARERRGEVKSDSAGVVLRLGH